MIPNTLLVDWVEGRVVDFVLGLGMLEVEKVDKAVTPQHLVGQVGGASLVGIWMLFSHLQNIAAITSSFQVWIFQCRNQHFKLSSLELCCQSALSLPPGSPRSRTWWCIYEYILLKIQHTKSNQSLYLVDILLMGITSAMKFKYSRTCTNGYEKHAALKNRSA